MAPEAFLETAIKKFSKILKFSGHELGMNLLNNPINAPEVDRMLTGNMIGAK